MSARTEIEKLEELIKDSIVGIVVGQTVQPLLPLGENFGSVIYKVDFKVRNGENIQTYHAVAKCTPPNKITQELLNTQVTYKSEIAWYTTVIPTIREFQRQHGIEDVANFFQTFYGARISLDPNSKVVDLNGVILTENLIPLGYRNIDRHIGFDLKTSKAILRDLATFHAVPIALKIKNQELFDKNIRPYLPNFKVIEDSSVKEEDRFKDVRNELKEIPEIIAFIDRAIANIEKNLISSHPSIPEEPWGSICHNDFWINNIMVKEMDNVKETKVMFLDFQFPAYASTAHDVLFFLSVSVAQEVIMEHMDELIQYYWNEFLKNLEELNIDSSLFTYPEFLKQIDAVACSGRFGHAFFHNYITLQDKGQAHIDSSNENFEKEDFKKKTFTLNSRHKEKYKWFILEFVKRGWI